MDSPAAFGHRHALHAVDAAFELELGEDAVAIDLGHGFLEAADVADIGADHFEPPALIGGETFVHPEQFGGEQRSLIAASPGADFEHGRTAISRIARQHGDRQRMLGLGQFGLEPGDLLLSQLAHFGIVKLGQRGQLSSHRRDFLGGLGHRLQLGIVAAGGNEFLALQRPRSQPRLDLGEAGSDLVEAGVAYRHRPPSPASPPSPYSSP